MARTVVIAEDEAIVRLDPVSYTHLDVYKRQVWRRNAAMLPRQSMRGLRPRVRRRPPSFNLESPPRARGRSKRDAKCESPSWSTRLANRLEPVCSKKRKRSCRGRKGLSLIHIWLHHVWNTWAQGGQAAPAFDTDKNRCAAKSESEYNTLPESPPGTWATAGNINSNCHTAEMTTR